MTTSGYLLWTIQVFAWLAVLTGIQFPVRKRGGIVARIIVLIVKVVLGIAVAAIVMVGIAPSLLRWYTLLVALYIALFGDAAGDLLHMILVRKNKGKRGRSRIVFGIVCTAIYFLAGTINMQTVSANRLAVSSPKLQESYRFVFVSDLHVGSSQSMKTTEKTIRKIDAEQADFVILGGDIVDAQTTKEEMEKTFSLIGEIAAPIYYIYGNHDRQNDYEQYLGRTFTVDELESAIRTNGIRILQDEWIPFSEDLVLFGREDYSVSTRKPIGDIPPRPEGSFVLLADHSPYETEDIIASGADLQISGHTHAGQLFPLQWIYRLAGYDAYGWFHHGETDVYVSSGASGWGFPFRTEAGCHYEVVTLQPSASASDEIQGG